MMRIRTIGVAVLALVAAACGNGGAKQDGAATGEPPVGVSAAPAAAGGGGAAAPATSGAGDPGAPAPAIAQRMAGRTNELINPEHPQMVFLYYSVAGLNPPLSGWVEDDARVRRADALEKEARRTEVNAELTALQQSVAPVGRIRMSLNGQLSEYDPNFGEFTIRSFAPSSSLSFRQYGQNVELRFRNGQYAQIWRVPQADAQAVIDRAGPGRYVTIDALFQIVDVQPGANGGAILVDVMEYEMRARNGGQTVGRVRVGG